MAENAPTSNNPKPPNTLNRRGRAIWRRIWSGNSHLSAANRAQVERYCILEQQAAELGKLLSSEGYTALGVKGQTIEHPAARTLRGIQSELRALSRRLGLDPTSRARLKAVERAEKPPHPADSCLCRDAERKSRADGPGICDNCEWCGIACWEMDAQSEMAGSQPSARRQPPLDDALLGSWLKHHALVELPEVWQREYARQQAASNAQAAMIRQNQAAFERYIRKHKAEALRRANTAQPRTEHKPGRP